MGMNQTKRYRIQKLDGRMTGHHLFSHRIRVYWNDDFLKIRHWIFENFGPACELDLFQSSQHLGLGYTWAWRTINHHRDIYLNQEQLSAFVLYNT
jgi:hypothetical protein